MARQPRCAAAGSLQLLDLRWCADIAARMDDADRDLQRELLAAATVRHGVALHAYGLGRSRALLLLTPDTAEGPAHLVQDLGRRMAGEMRRRHGHAGPLLAGRFRSAILQPERHLLEAMRFVEQLPWRDADADGDAAAWRWSSAAVHRGSARDELVIDHPAYWRSGNTPFEREARHRERLAEPLSVQAVHALEAALSGGWPLGDAEFLEGLARQLRRRVTPRSPGRPRKQATSGGGDMSPI